MDVFLFWILWTLATLAAQVMDHFIFRGLGYAAALLGWVQSLSDSAPGASLGLVFLSTGLLGLIDGAVMGFFQWAALRQRARVTAWWVLSTMLGTGVGMGLFYLLLGGATPGLLAAEIPVDQVLWLGIADRALLGLVLGSAQWFVLRKRMPAALSWIPWLILTMVAAWAARFYINLAVSFLTFSVFTGLFFALFPLANDAPVHVKPTSEVALPTSEVG